MKQVYPVIFTKIQDEKNTILIEVPDLEILTEGFGIVNAIDMARDAIGVKGIYYDDQGKELPNPRELKDIDISKGTFYGDGEGTVTLIDVDFNEYRRKLDNKSVRRNVTLPNWLNREAERFCSPLKKTVFPSNMCLPVSIP